MESFELPKFWMPYESAGVNPGLEETDGPLWAWLDAQHLADAAAAREYVRRTRPTLASALYHPNSESTALLPQAQYMAWAFIVDDELDDGPIGRDPAACEAAITRMIAVFDGDVADDPLTRALGDLWPRLAEGKSMSWQKSFWAGQATWLWTTYVEAVNRVTGHIQSVPEYQQHRCNSIGEYMMMDLCEVGTRIDLPDAVRRLPAMRTLRQSAAGQIGTFNDICSARKDMAAGNRLNLVLLLKEENELSLQEAVERANGIATDWLTKLNAARAALGGQLDAAGITGDTREDALAAADNVIALVRGNFDYHFMAERYTDPLERNIGAPDYVGDLLRTPQPRGRANHQVG
ncbi:terpene synthase family protein [Streptomyces sp. NPDC090741]|uniref:terpene synthase family protein n=1 Tax=Streptomyces sp. NPDC090741 TaxID=3365967 RepID=UPI0037F35CC0